MCARVCVSVKVCVLQTQKRFSPPRKQVILHRPVRGQSLTWGLIRLVHNTLDLSDQPQRSVERAGVMSSRQELSHEWRNQRSRSSSTLASHGDLVVFGRLMEN